MKVDSVPENGNNNAGSQDQVLVNDYRLEPNIYNSERSENLCNYAQRCACYQNPVNYFITNLIKFILMNLCGFFQHIKKNKAYIKLVYFQLKKLYSLFFSSVF